jgi:hypothetical protein
MFLPQKADAARVCAGIRLVAHDAFGMVIFHSCRDKVFRASLATVRVWRRS